MLQRVGDSVEHECRHRRRARREPPLAVLVDRDRLELDAPRTKELLGQPAERSAGMGEEHDAA
jgi:hypothetical protein